MINIGRSGGNLYTTVSLLYRFFQTAKQHKTLIGLIPMQGCVCHAWGLWSSICEIHK